MTFLAHKPSPRAHYLMRFIWAQCAAEGKSMDIFCQKAGVAYSSVKRAMRGHGHISLPNLEALLNELGYTLKPTPLEAQPPRPIPKPSAALPATPHHIPPANGK